MNIGGGGSLTIFHDPHIITLGPDRLLQIRHVLGQFVHLAAVEFDGIFCGLCYGRGFSWRLV